PAVQAVVVAEDQQHLGLVVGLAEGAGVVGVVDLPARTLGVAEPDVAVVAELVLGGLGLEADLELGLDVVDALGLQRRAVDGRGRRAVGTAAPERRQQVHRLVPAHVEGPELGVARQLPAAVQQRAAAGVGQRAPRVVVVGEDLAAGVARARARLVEGGRAGRGLVRLPRARGDPAHGAIVAGQALGRGLDRQAGLERRRRVAGA